MYVTDQDHNPVHKTQQGFLPFKKPQSSVLFDEIKVEQLSSKDSTENNQINFYEQEISKLMYANTVIMAQLSSAFEEKNIILQLIREAEKRQNHSEDCDKVKRVRRSAKEIQRKHNCPVKGCEKSYGTEGSLIQHMRLKHQKFTQNEPPLMLDPA